MSIHAYEYLYKNTQYRYIIRLYKYYRGFELKKSVKAISELGITCSIIKRDSVQNFDILWGKCLYLPHFCTLSMIFLIHGGPIYLPIKYRHFPFKHPFMVCFIISLAATVIILKKYLLNTSYKGSGKKEFFS